MGPYRDAAPGAGGRALTRIAQVVPNLATFAVDDGFSYRIPDTLGDVSVGSMVRIPLGGRRLRGFVTHLRQGADPGNLKDILAVVGDLPVFTGRLLETLRWAAIHYVAPTAVLLSKTAPPNVVRRLQPGPGVAFRAGMVDSPLPDVTAAVVAGRRPPGSYLVGGGPWAGAVGGLVGDVLAAGRNAAVVVPTVAEAHRLRTELAGLLGIDPLLATSQEAAAGVTRAWSTMNRAAETTAGSLRAGTLLVGTREIALWPYGDVGMVVVIEEGRPAMKAPQSPTLGVRDVLRRRTATERFGLVMAGPVPTVEALAGGLRIEMPSTRVWPLVEIVDRSIEPPGGNIVMAATQRAIQGVVGAGGTVFGFVTRRGDAAAFRCVACGELRRCPDCGAAAVRNDVCLRCGRVHGACPECGGGRFQPLGAAVGRLIHDLRRALGEVVTPVGEGGLVQVGTERDLPGVPPVDLAVVVDPDSLMLAPHYRAEEDALRTLARVALTVAPRRGRRCLVQTTQPGHRVLEALRLGRPRPLLDVLLREREAVGFPPAGELMAIEMAGATATVDEELRAVAQGAQVTGPARGDDRERWLVAAGDLRPLKLRLRGEVQRWRDAGVRVRIDADPVRL